MNIINGVTLYTDGGALGNPGPGGYGVVLKHRQQRKELSGGFRLTTNNRMELMAAISALEKLNTACDVTLYTDSRYVADSINLGWAKRWRANGWRKNKTEAALNPDLWERLLNALAQHQVRVLWVKDPQVMLELIAALKPDDRSTLRLRRDRTVIEAQVRIGKRPAMRSEQE